MIDRHGRRDGLRCSSNRGGVRERGWCTDHRCGDEALCLRRTEEDAAGATRGLYSLQST